MPSSGMDLCVSKSAAFLRPTKFPDRTFLRVPAARRNDGGLSVGRRWAHGPREVLEERLRRRGDGGARGGRRLGLQARRRRGERRGAGTAEGDGRDTSHGDAEVRLVGLCIVARQFAHASINREARATSSPAFENSPGFQPARRSAGGPSRHLNIFTCAPTALTRLTATGPLDFCCFCLACDELR